LIVLSVILVVSPVTLPVKVSLIAGETH